MFIFFFIELTNTCTCGNELKKIHDLKRTILTKEQKILELQDLEKENTLYKSQLKYLKYSLEQEKKKVCLAFTTLNSYLCVNSVSYNYL